jgi:hypothetical protein
MSTSVIPKGRVFPLGPNRCCVSMASAAYRINRVKGCYCTWILGHTGV